MPSSEQHTTLEHVYIPAAYRGPVEEHAASERGFWELWRQNPQLNPTGLAGVFPGRGYERFVQTRNQSGLWVLKGREEIESDSERCDKIFLLISGAPAAGKNALDEVLVERFPGLTYRMVTGTSREPREGEIHGKDYFYYPGLEAFMTAVNEDRLIEHIRQGSGADVRMYGLPKASVDLAMEAEAPVIVSQVEMRSGWPRLMKYLEEVYSGCRLAVVKVYVMPDMSFCEYAFGHLREHRGEEAAVRARRAAWELSVAGKRADAILGNRIEASGSALVQAADGLAEMMLGMIGRERREITTAGA